MFENLMVIVAIVVILWLAGFTVYLYASRQQEDLTDQIEDLRHLLNGIGEDAEN
jgi:hypothetical protein